MNLVKKNKKYACIIAALQFSSQTATPVPTQLAKRTISMNYVTRIYFKEQVDEESTTPGPVQLDKVNAVTKMKPR